MDRPIWYTLENLRGYDLSKGAQDAFKGISKAVQDVLGQGIAIASGLVASASSPNSLTLNIGSGSLYLQTILDPSSAGDLPTDGQTYFLQGIAWAPQSVTLSTAALASGQSQWALIQAGFSFSDVIRSSDPTGGLLPFYNAANPTQPLQGQGNTGVLLPTARTATVVLSVVYGTPATTGSEVPPSAASGNVGLYLVDLSYGQTAISQAQILVAKPSAGTGVPSTYPYAPFLAGLLNQHHLGIPGQAPQINLTQEVQGILPNANTTASTGAVADTIALRDANAELTAAQFNTTSDRRLKKNIKRIKGALALLDLFRGVTFEWKGTNEKSAGLIAQEFYTAMPIGDGHTVNAMAVIAVLTEALREERDARLALERCVKRLEQY